MPRPKPDHQQTIVIPKFTVPTLEEILPALGTHKHKCFTIVDALDGFTQGPLSEESSLVTAMHVAASPVWCLVRSRGVSNANAGSVGRSCWYRQHRR